MKINALLLAAMLVAGCTPLQQMTYCSWLERVGQRAPPRHPDTTEQSQALRARADELHARAEALRVKMASERDRVQRVKYLRQLEDIGDELHPIERRLRDGGRNGFF